MKKHNPGCPCCEEIACATVFDNTFNATTDGSPPCAGGPWYTPGFLTLNATWWSQISGAAVTPQNAAPCGGGAGGQSTVKVNNGGGLVELLNTTTINKTNFRAYVEFYPRTTGDVFGVRIDRTDASNRVDIEFVATNQAPDIAVYRVVAGVRTKLRRKVNAAGTTAGEGFYFNLATRPCPKIFLNISLARGVLLVQVTGEGTQPDGAGTTYSALDYNYDWTGTHTNPEGNGVTGPGSAAGTSSVTGPDIGYRPLILSCGSETSGTFTMSSGAWSVYANPAGTYLEIGAVDAWDTTLNPDDVTTSCAGLSCHPLTVCNGLITEYPLQITGTASGIDCGPKARLWEKCADSSTTYTDCNSTPGAGYDKVTEELCDNFNADFVCDWTPIVSGSPDFCSYFTHDANNPDYRETFVHCATGSAGFTNTGHAGFVLLTGIVMGFGVEDLVTPPHHNLNQDPTAPIDFPAYWKPSDVIGVTGRNQGIIGSSSDEQCLWEDQVAELVSFTYEASD